MASGSAFWGPVSHPWRGFLWKIAMNTRKLLMAGLGGALAVYAALFLYLA